MNAREGGELAGSTKFAFRSREDPRFTDRRMQNLLRKLDDNFLKYDSNTVTSICKLSRYAYLLCLHLVYCTVKLRLPEDEIMKKSINFIIENMKEFDSKQTALTLWALAKMNYPSKHIQNLILRKV